MTIRGDVMQPIISGREGNRIRIEVTIDLSGSMLEAEESILRGVNAVGESRSRKSEQRDKWSFCLTASKISPRIRRDDEQETTPESHTKLQGQGGACRHQGRDDAFTACGAF